MRHKSKPNAQRELGQALELDEARIIIIKLLEATERDYLNLENSTIPIEKWYFLTAESFIYEETYKINWGDSEKSFSDLCEIVDIDPEWYRDKIEKEREILKKKKQINQLLDGE